MQVFIFLEDRVLVVNFNCFPLAQGNILLREVHFKNVRNHGEIIIISNQRAD